MDSQFSALFAKYNMLGPDPTPFARPLLPPALHFHLGPLLLLQHHSQVLQPLIQRRRLLMMMRMMMMMMRMWRWLQVMMRTTMRRTMMRTTTMRSDFPF